MTRRCWPGWRPCEPLCAQLPEVHRSNLALRAREPHLWRRHITSDLCRGTDQMHILAAIAEFERGRIVERVRAGLKRARANGQRLGRPSHDISAQDLTRTSALSVRQAAALLGLPASVVHRARKRSENLSV